MRSAVLVLLVLLAAPARAPADPPERKAPTEHTLKVAAFNCWLLPFASSDLPARRKKLPDALRALKMDVLCLQEVWLASDQTLLIEALAKSHPHAARGKGGLLVLSRFPITSQRFVAFPVYPGLSFAERMAGKGLLDSQVRTPGGTLRVINTHLTWKPGTDNARTKQIGFLLKTLAPYAKQALVLAGDFNTSALASSYVIDPQYQRLLSAGLRPARPPTQVPGSKAYFHPRPTRQGWPRSDDELQGWDPDHVFVRPSEKIGITVQDSALHFTKPADALSDHNLLAVTLRLRTAPR